MNEKQVLQNSFSNLIAFPRLEEANRNAKKQKRYRDEIIKFNNDLDANLLQIRDDLENECFRAIVPVTTTIRAPAKSMARSPILKLYFYSFFAGPFFTDSI